MTDRVAANGPADAVRRAPFGANPHVGARGQRTRHRILDAALRVFGDVGLYHGSVERIAKEAGCSRAALYQYFADKDDLLRHLAAQLTLQLDAAVAWLRPVTPDAEGWASLRDLVERWGEIHERHQPVFDAFPVMLETDATFAEDATRARSRFVSAIAARVRNSDLAQAAVDGTVDLFLVSFPRAFEDIGMLRRAVPGAFPRGATLDALTDVVHRALFSLDPAVNVHEHDLPAPPRLPFGPLVRSGMEHDGRTGGDRATRAALLDAARTGFLRHGYHGTRIDAIAERAGLSHGTLYTYFHGKDHVAQVLALDAMRAAADTLQRLPDVQDGTASRAAVRRWLADYNQAQAGATAMIRVWSDALRNAGDPVREIAPTLDWGRRRLSRRLAERGFGDVDLEAAVLLAFLSSLGGRERTPSELDTAALVLQRGFFGARTGD
ncbi:MAG: TetR/AcrR family transcriptional regulator [Acidimicrobiia bacterium]